MNNENLLLIFGAGLVGIISVIIDYALKIALLFMVYYAYHITVKLGHINSHLKQIIVLLGG